MPASRAAPTASDDGALTATTVPNPAAHAFCTISKLARPLTYRPRSAAGRAPSSSSRPTTLSTALWRPMSSRASTRRRAVEGHRGVDAAGQVEQLLVARDPVGHRRPARRGGNGGRGGRGCRRSRRSSTAVVPHMPQAEVVAVSRGGGTGARPPVSTVTTLNSLSTAEPVPQYLHGAPGARQQALGEAEPGGQLEVVARRAHGGGDQHAVEVDLQRLLDDELVGAAAEAVAVVAVREHLGRSRPAGRRGTRALDVAQPPDRDRPSTASPTSSASRPRGRTGRGAPCAARPRRARARYHVGGDHAVEPLAVPSISSTRALAVGQAATGCPVVLEELHVVGALGGGSPTGMPSTSQGISTPRRRRWWAGCRST